MCDDDADIRYSCDAFGGGCVNWNDQISSMEMVGDFCNNLWSAINYQGTTALPYPRGTCDYVNDMRDQCVVSSGWICGENWSNVVSSFKVF